MTLRSPRRPGVTILECLITLAILVMALTAIGRLVDFGTDRAVEAQIQSRGTRLAQAKMAEAEAGTDEVPLDGGEKEGNFPEEPGWTWKVTSQPEISSDSGPLLYRVTVTVSRTVNNRPYNVTLTQHVLNPQFVGAAAPVEVPKPASSSTTTAGAPQP